MAEQGTAPPAPGLHVQDVRACDACGNGLTKTLASLNAYRIRLDSLILDQAVVRSLGGLTLFFQGHAKLAEVFAPDVDVYKCFGRDELLLCFDCYAFRPLCAVAGDAARRRGDAAAATGAEVASSPDSQADGHRDPDPDVELGDPGA